LVLGLPKHGVTLPKASRGVNQAPFAPFARDHPSTRPQYYRVRRILEMIREGCRRGAPPNCGHFDRQLHVSWRTLMRDLDFLRDDEYAPIAYDESRKRGFRRWEMRQSALEFS